MDKNQRIEKAKNTIVAKGNVIKTREDRGLILVDKDGKIQNSDECNWVPADDKDVDKNVFRDRIEPWLTSLFQSEHLSLLCGSGLSTAISYLAGAGSGTTMSGTTFAVYDDKIKKTAKLTAEASGRKDGNIEDQIRTANDLLRGLKVLENTADAVALSDSLKSIITSFANSILESEKALAEANEDKRENAFSVLVNFLLSFASRTGNRERLNIFTTNYDRLIEVGSELAGIHLMDRFIGTLMPIFRSSRLNLDIHYNPPGIRGEPRYLEGVARLSKLHGSVDWIQVHDEIRRIGLPFGATNIDAFLQAPGLKGSDALKMMIYPNSAKDRETAEYPYVELFRDFAASVCRPNSTLVTYGYGFGDEHINRVIRDMLTIPSTHLVVISYDDPIGRILKFYYDTARPAQVSVLMGQTLGDITNLANDFLPKSAIDKATIRMAELLQHRMGPSVSSTTSSTTASASSGPTSAIGTAAPMV